ncbi:Pyruvate-formate lyase-activating enzyme [Dehalogenimonas formicexedens]|uniref:Pyruvate-formate lyase-activating enzyme n=1 Tax=Dehalogenimonas formicexedens TaxID=1839801 RepID=A0A1P8F5D9_9CHLR|nr:radical SAM protein [Dehalogenimonas formicexedens]APV43683.1 Pyruvate-formate lyase-activating enzyme [Dehalogenimonas formicexedens]
MNTRIFHITYTPEQKDVCVHFWGCNFKCRGCYCVDRIYSPMLDFRNLLKLKSDGAAKPPCHFLSLPEVQRILDGLEFKTVVIEGQEAGLDPAYSAFTRMIHERYGATVTLVTNACALPDLSHTDTIEIGLKALDDSLHVDYTGVSNQRTLENFDKLIAMGKKLVVDTVLIPDYIDSGEIERIAVHVASRDPNMPFILLPYFPAGVNPWRRPTPAEMDEAAERVKRHLKRVFYFRGGEELKYPIYNVFPEEACQADRPDSKKWLATILQPAEALDSTSASCRPA